MHFSLSQQRAAFLTKACLGAVRPCHDRLDASQLIVTTDRYGVQRLVLATDDGPPLLVNPLLLGFNRAKRHFQEAGGGGVASENQSARAGGEELSWQYSLRLVEYQDEQLLIGVQNDNPAAAKLLIARSRKPAIAKVATEPVEGERDSLFLEPGWRLVQQTYNNQRLDHLYLVQDEALAQLTTSYGSEEALQPITVQPQRERPQFTPSKVEKSQASFTQRVCLLAA